MDTKRRYKRRGFSFKKLVGICMLVFSVLVFICACFPNFLSIGKFFQGLLGVTVYPINLLFALIGVALTMDLNYTLNSKYVAYITISLVCLLGLFHTIFTTKSLSDDMTAFKDFNRYLGLCFNMSSGITVGGAALGIFVFLIRGLIGVFGTYAFFSIFATIFIGLTIDYMIYSKKREKRHKKLTDASSLKQVDAEPDIFEREESDQMYSFSKKRETKPPVFEGWEEEEPTTVPQETPLFNVTDDKTEKLLESDESINFSFNSNNNVFTESDNSQEKEVAKSILFGDGSLNSNNTEEQEGPKTARDILFGNEPKVPNIFDRSSEERDAWRQQYASKPLQFGEEKQEQEVNDTSTYDENDDGSMRTSWGTYKPTSLISRSDSVGVNSTLKENDTPNFFGGATFNNVNDISNNESVQNINRSREIRRNSDLDSVQPNFSNNNFRNNEQSLVSDAGLNDHQNFGFREGSSFNNDRFTSNRPLYENNRNIDRAANINEQREIRRNESPFDSRFNQEPNKDNNLTERKFGDRRLRERTSLSNFNRMSEPVKEENTEFSSRLSSHEDRNPDSDILANASSLGIEGSREEKNPFVSALKEAEKDKKAEVKTPEKTKVEKISFVNQLNTKYNPPPTDILNLVKEEKVDYSSEYKEKTGIIESILSNFKIPAKVNNVVRGPKVTRFELGMPMGIPVSRVLSYEKDLSMGLASKSGVRIEAPIPGKNAFGIEVENAKPSMVGFRELVESNEFKTFKHPLPVAIGKNISGEIVVKGLGRMVHCLVAGSTGSGKSVFLHSLIVSLMYRHSPEELRFIMIDPKRVEFSRYNRMPHLMLPEVVTECSKAVNALTWAVKEMERRYELLRVNECQKIEQFNECPAVKSGSEKKLPYLVIVVDELAELMSVAAKEAEQRIQRITQLGRAAGIHMVIATQRPSVDVVTGTIKNNLPTRIAFALASAVDSQTIINQGGAEKLLGQGDMLLSAQDSNAIVRLQAAFVSDEEIKKVLNYIKENNISVYDEEIQKSIYAEPEAEETSSSDAEDKAGSGEREMDEYMPQALKLVMKNGKASISMIQRRFSVGYARAARIIDQMETRGFIDSGLGNKPRDVKITIAEYNELFGDFDAE